MVVRLPINGDEPTEPIPTSIQAYVTQCGRGRAIPVDFEADLRSCLQELNLPQRISPRRRRYWTIPAYALAHRIHTRTLCKRFRELEKNCKESFPGACASTSKSRPVDRRAKSSNPDPLQRDPRLSNRLRANLGLRLFAWASFAARKKAELIAQREQRLRAQEEKEASTFPLEEEETF